MSTVLVIGCNGVQNESFVSNRIMLGTTCKITTWDKDTDFNAVWKKIAEIEKTISAHDETSELAKLNGKAGGEWVTVSPILYQAVSQALEIAGLSDGAFNPAIGVLVDLWGIGEYVENKANEINPDNVAAPVIPSDSEIAEALKHIDWHSIELKTAEDGSFMIRIKDKGTEINLGGIGKGIAADIAAAELARQGVSSALINFGGNVMCLGARTDGDKFRIGIQIPFEERNNYSQVLKVSDSSVVTSGTYEKYFVDADGVLYHHILDGGTGFPARTGLLSVTIVGPSSAVCDGLSTACFVLGLERATQLIGMMKGYGAIFIEEDSTVVPVGIEL